MLGPAYLLTQVPRKLDLTQQKQPFITNTKIQHCGAKKVYHPTTNYNWRYVALVVVLWHPALSLSVSASVTALIWEPVNIRLIFGVSIGLDPD